MSRSRDFDPEKINSDDRPHIKAALVMMIVADAWLARRGYTEDGNKDMLIREHFPITLDLDDMQEAHNKLVEFFDATELKHMGG